jgi:hypothetical protein
MYPTTLSLTVILASLYYSVQTSDMNSAEACYIWALKLSIPEMLIQIDHSAALCSFHLIHSSACKRL